MQNDGSLLSLLLRKISSGFPHLLHHDKHFRVFHTNFRRGPASSSNLESTAYHHHIYWRLIEATRKQGKQKSGSDTLKVDKRKGEIQVKAGGHKLFAQLLRQADNPWERINPCGRRGEVEWVKERLDEPDRYWAPKTQPRISEAGEEAAEEAGEEAGNRSWRSRERTRAEIESEKKKTSESDRDDDDGDGVSRQQRRRRRRRHALATKFLHPHMALFSLPTSIHLPTTRLQFQLRALMDDKPIHHHHHHHPHRWEMESIMIQKTAKWKKDHVYAKYGWIYILKILPSHTHPSTHSLDYSLNWELSWTINPWCIIIHTDEMCKTKINNPKRRRSTRVFFNK